MDLTLVLYYPLQTKILFRLPGVKQPVAAKVAQPSPSTGTLILGARAGLHDNVPADLLPMWQKVRQSRATQLRCTDVPDWATTYAMQPTFWDSDSFNF